MVILEARTTQQPIVIAIVTLYFSSTSTYHPISYYCSFPSLFLSLLLSRCSNSIATNRHSPSSRRRRSADSTRPAETPKAPQFPHSLVAGEQLGLLHSTSYSSSSLLVHISPSDRRYSQCPGVLYVPLSIVSIIWCPASSIS
jgi:hypothetical protein